MEKGIRVGRLREAAEILDGLVQSKEFVAFSTFPAYPIWTRRGVTKG